MTRLIHLNGPSRVGKSTLAARYAAEHPGTSVLDLDALAAQVDGWQGAFSAALDVARERARQLADRHLRAGAEVVLPQLVTVHDTAPDPALEETARGAGAAYVQVALTIDEAEHLQRLRAKRPTTEVEAHVQAALVEPGSDLVERIRRHLDEYLEQRPPTARIDTTGLDENEAYARLVEALRI